MACAGCQKRREAIARLAAKVGTIVFGGKKRVLAAPQAGEGLKRRDRGERRA
jgi:hypothetical protein